MPIFPFSNIPCYKKSSQTSQILGAISNGRSAQSNEFTSHPMCIKCKIHRYLDTVAVSLDSELFINCFLGKKVYEREL